MKKRLLKLIEYFLIFMIILLYNLFFINITNVDEIWTFGFSYNIANGLVPYKDFNMVVGPVYPTFISVFLYLFGTNMIAFSIGNSIIYIFIYYFIKRLTSVYVAMPLTLITVFFLFPGYNSLCLLLFLIILYMEKTSSNDYIIGVLLAILCLTKINVGVFLLIPSFFFYFRKSNIYKLLKRMFSFLIIWFISILIMFINESLFDFINYTLLGLFSFGSRNLHIDYAIIFWIIILIYLIYSVFRCGKKDKLFIAYNFCFLVISYPLFDFFHVYVSIIPSLIYILSKSKIHRIGKKMLVIGCCYLTFCFYFSVIYYNITSKLVRYENNVFLKYKMIESDLSNNLDFIKNKFDNFDSDKKLYIFSTWAYLYKMELGIPIDKFDLINDGNMGFDGENEFIKEIDDYCKNNSCVFLISRDEYDGRKTEGQLNKKILEYVINNYNLRDSFSNSEEHFEIYDNTKMCMFEK